MGPNGFPDCDSSNAQAQLPIRTTNMHLFSLKLPQDASAVSESNKGFFCVYARLATSLIISV